MMEKAVFLDRDGTINIEKEYLYRPQDFEWIGRAPEAIQRMNELGYKVIVISNQSGIARGFYTSRDVRALHEQIDCALVKYGARIDAYYFCPHHPDYGAKCECRKPKTGLIEQAVKEFNIDIDSSWMVGDKVSDIECAKKAGLKSALVLTGYGRDAKADCGPMLVCEDLIDFVNKAII